MNWKEREREGGREEVGGIGDQGRPGPGVGGRTSETGDGRGKLGLDHRLRKLGVKSIPDRVTEVILEGRTDGWTAHDQSLFLKRERADMTRSRSSSFYSV